MKYTQEERAKFVLRALSMKRQGTHPASIALVLGVSRLTLDRWIHQARISKWRCPHCDGHGRIRFD